MGAVFRPKHTTTVKIKTMLTTCYPFLFFYILPQESVARRAWLSTIDAKIDAFMPGKFIVVRTEYSQT